MTDAPQQALQFTDRSSLGTSTYEIVNGQVRCQGTYRCWSTFDVTYPLAELREETSTITSRHPAHTLLFTLAMIMTSAAIISCLLHEPGGSTWGMYALIALTTATALVAAYTWRRVPVRYYLLETYNLAFGVRDCAQAATFITTLDRAIHASRGAPPAPAVVADPTAAVHSIIFHHADRTNDREVRYDVANGKLRCRGKIQLGGAFDAEYQLRDVRNEVHIHAARSANFKGFLQLTALALATALVCWEFNERPAVLNTLEIAGMFVLCMGVAAWNFSRREPYRHYLRKDFGSLFLVADHARNREFMRVLAEAIAEARR